MSVTLDTSAKFLSQATAIVTTTPFSFAAWVNLTTTGSFNTIFSLDTGSGATTDFKCFIDSNSFVAAETKLSGTTGTARTAVAITTGVWQHVACVFTSSTLRAVYLNGGNKATNTNSIAPTGLTTSRLGGDPSGTLVFAGNLGVSTFWNNLALSDADVASLATGSDPRRVHPEGIISCPPVNYSAAIGLDYFSATQWTVNGSPSIATDNPALFMATRSTTVPFFAVQNATVTISPVVTLSLTATVSGGGGVTGGHEVYSDGLGGHFYP